MVVLLLRAIVCYSGDRNRFPVLARRLLSTRSDTRRSLTYTLARYEFIGCRVVSPGISQ
jgi:hypothetical protein